MTVSTGNIPQQSIVGTLHTNIFNRITILITYYSLAANPEVFAKRAAPTKNTMATIVPFNNIFVFILLKF